MAPKKATTGKKPAATSSHPPYADMIKEAIINLKERSGSSRQSIKKYVQANNDVSGVSDAVFANQINKALSKGSETGVFLRPKGPSGPVKLAAPAKSTDSKPAAPKAAKAPAKAKATKTTTTTKKPAAASKKTTTKTTTKTKAPGAKKTATTTKTTKSPANTSKPRKTAAAAPAVEEPVPVVTGKTKSGRVTKSKAPGADKKAAVKKAPTKKKAPAAAKKA